MKLLLSSLVFLTSILTPFVDLSAKIIETRHFNEIIGYADYDNVLIILDIDDTLLVPVQTLGTDVWFRDRINVHQREGMAFENAIAKTIIEWEAIRHLTKVKIVEEGIEKNIQAMQKNNVHIMGLTTQSLTLTTCTTQQLLSLGINLFNTAPSRENYYFMNGQGVLYTQGILFTNGTDKGKALFSYLDHIGYLPKFIVFINDKETHLKEVEKEVLPRAVEFIGLRYSYSDSRVDSYDSRISDLQWKYSTLSNILSDDEAKALIKADKS